MATPGLMTKVIADAIARPPSTVTSYYAVLRKGGLISTTGRGKGAQHLSPLDVARILIVMLSADALQEGEAITQLVGALERERSYEDAGSAVDLRFENALAGLIDFKAKELRRLDPANFSPLGDLRSEAIEVRVTATDLKAEVIVDGLSTWFSAPPYVHFPTIDPRDWQRLPMKERLIHRATIEGMSVTRSIDQLVLYKVACAMP